jgi:hypothetical protein
MMVDYLINPVKMGGLVKEVYDDGKMVKIYLHGRLGVIKVPRGIIRQDIVLEPGHELEFYFSYIQIVSDPYDYSSNEMDPAEEIFPSLLGGKVIDVNDTAVTVRVMDDLGEITVPRRWIITDKMLEEGDEAEFYFSCMDVTGKRDLPAMFI